MREELASSWIVGLNELGLTHRFAWLRPRLRAWRTDGTLRLVLRPSVAGMVVAFRFVDTAGQRVRGVVALEQLAGRWSEWLAALSASGPGDAEKGPESLN